MDVDAIPLVEQFAPARRSLRIALVTETYPPEINGVATTVAQFVRELRDRGHEIQLVRPRQGTSDTPHVGDSDHEVLRRAVAIPRYPGLRMGLPARRSLHKLWAARRPDLVHIVTEGPLGWSALRAARKLRLPVSSEFRTNFHTYSGHYGLGWLRRPIVGYLRRFHNMTALTLVPTEAMRRELTALGVREVAVVARGVDTTRFQPSHRSAALRAQWGASPHATVALYVGRLAPEKNLETLARAWREMRARSQATRLVVVGDGPSATSLRESCPDAIFAGVRTGLELAVHYASADVFLFPSTTETFGNVTLEAMASGLAVVAFDHAAAGEHLVDGRSGLLAPFGDDEAFVRRAASLAGRVPAARALGDAALATARELGWAAVALRLEGFLLRFATDEPATRHPAAVPSRTSPA